MIATPLGMTDIATPVQMALGFMPTRDLAEELHRRGNAEAALADALPTDQRLALAEDALDQAVARLEDATEALRLHALRDPWRDAIALVAATMDGRRDDVAELLRPYGAGTDYRLVASLIGLAISLGREDPSDFSGELLEELSLCAAADV